MHRKLTNVERIIIDIHTDQCEDFFKPNESTADIGKEYTELRWERCDVTLTLRTDIDKDKINYLINYGDRSTFGELHSGDDFTRIWHQFIYFDDNNQMENFHD